jgi:hypothetical protein
MFEIGVSAFILFAIGYWATLFIMGRREDVLHGQFVEAEPELAAAGAGVSASFLQPVLPPVRKAAPVPAPMPAPVVERAPAPSERTPAPESAPVTTAASDADAWDTLLASIKLELKNASQI